MDLYRKKSTWKIYLGIGGMVIMLIAMGFTYFLVDKLQAEEGRKMELYRMAQTEAATGELSDELSDITVEVLTSNANIPVMVVEGEDKIIQQMNFVEQESDDLSPHMPYLQRELKKIKASGAEPLLIIGTTDQRLYYKNSKILTWLKYFPVVMLGLLAAFIALGYIGFSASRRSEQNQVWVGMAKETAHQLGTPISAIIAWIEHLKLEERSEDKLEIISELEHDIERLNLIADRFSKIGSEPLLEQKNIFAELKETEQYMQRRAPRKVQFDFPNSNEQPIPVLINSHLFSWVLENLIRNALDAMEGKGEIKAEVVDLGDQVAINLSDTGKGIPASKQKTVFQPGYTTKKRGWGLGLSLAKRIIENYHKGKIFVSRSEPKMGTTFSIHLPKSAS